MRNHAIILKDSTQQQRQKLFDFLVAKEEAIYTKTTLTKDSYPNNYFRFSPISSSWIGSSSSGDLPIVSIPDFITKFQEPELDIRDYCIDCTDSTLSERRQVINYLKSILEDVYRGTAFKDDTDLKGEIFGYDEDSQEWCTGIEETSHILTTKEFIAKFINTGDVMSTIKVGDIYKNSMGKICTILNNSESSNIMYKHEDGKNFTTSSSNITKNWTKQPTSNVKPRGNYKVGDKVKIRADLTPSTKYGMNGKRKVTVLTPDMNRDCAGKIATITKVFTDYYLIDLDKGYHSWVDEMFKDIEPATKVVIANLQPGTKVRVRQDLKADEIYGMVNRDEQDSATKSMTKRAGTIVTIDRLNLFGLYCIKEDRGECNWTDEMFSEIITATEEQSITYNIDKSKLTPGIVIHCDTYEKAVAITSLIDNTINTEQYANFENIGISITETTWHCYELSYFTKNTIYTITPFEDVLVPTTCKFKVGDLVRLRDDIQHAKSYNNTIFYSSFSFEGSQPIQEIDGSLVDVRLNTYWYGIDALELVPQTYEQKGIAQLKEKTVAHQEPIKPIKKEESFMSKLKATAITTIDQNKEAAIIAAKMEAGRVINKQVIKQAAKHVPFWAKGYLDTPLAPVVLANAVAMLGNHTGNPKVQKVSELMLLAAADVTVQSFNLDQIIDDILAGIKLPAGVLDDAE